VPPTIAIYQENIGFGAAEFVKFGSQMDITEIYVLYVPKTAVQLMHYWFVNIIIFSL